MLVRLALVATLFIVGACCPPGLTPPQRAPGPAPQPLAATLFTLDGQPTRLAAYQGQVVLLDFWASWCAPCRQAFPYYADIHARRGNQGLVVVAVSVDEDRGVARQFARRWGLPFEVLHDSQHEGAAAYSVTQIPTSFLLDRLGRVRFVHRGFDPARADRLDEEVLFLLSE